MLLLLLLLRLLLLLKLNSLCYLVVSLPLLKVNLWCTHGARRLLPLVFAACVWVRICVSSLPALSFPRVTYVGCARNRFVSKCRGQFFTLFFFLFFFRDLNVLFFTRFVLLAMWLIILMVY